MTPEQQAQFEEMYAWFQARKQQQLEYPVDDASKNALGVVTYQGPSTHATSTTVTIPSGGGTVTVPVVPTGFISVNIEGGTYLLATYT